MVRTSSVTLQQTTLFDLVWDYLKGSTLAIRIFLKVGVDEKLKKRIPCGVN